MRALILHNIHMTREQLSYIFVVVHFTTLQNEEGNTAIPAVRSLAESEPIATTYVLPARRVLPSF